MHKDTVQIVVFKPDPTKTKEYMVILDDVNAYNKWKGTKGEEGDKTVALVEIVDAFKVVSHERNECSNIKERYECTAKSRTIN